MEIVHAELSDAYVIAQIHIQGWQEAYRGIIPDDQLFSLDLNERVKDWEKRILEGNSQILLAKEGQLIHGWVSFGASRDDDASPNIAEIYAFYVAPNKKNCGIGKLLWRSASERVIAMGWGGCTLWVLMDNLPAIGFYKGLGFHAEEKKVAYEMHGDTILKEQRYSINFNE